MLWPDPLRPLRSWVEEHLRNGKSIREGKWTGSIAVGSKSFIEHVKSILGGLVKGRKIKENGDGYQLRESSVPYGGFLETKNEDIGHRNTYFGEINTE